MIEQRTLGASGISVSILGLGTVKLGRAVGVRYPTDFVIPDDAAVRTLLTRCRDTGINLIDTAPAYGNSEARLGELLYADARREDWVIITKTGEEFDGAVSRYDFSPEHTQYSVRRSLKRLNTDYLDVVLIHSNGDDTHILERMGTLDALAALKAQGLIRAIGISHKTVEGGSLAVDKGADAIMTELNRAERRQLPVIARAVAQGCGVLIKKALVSGQGSPEDLKEVVNEPGVTSVVVGTINPAHLDENVRLIQSAD
ncbi:MAG: aldo/keto reductase [Proteobacteria bacterium]|nr:aldo/keto reductase [Pseudomonadota bacterium]